MVGDSLPHDIEGARRVGMRGILVQRSPDAALEGLPGVTVIHNLWSCRRCCDGGPGRDLVGDPYPNPAAR